MYTKLDFYVTDKPRNNTGIVTSGAKSYPNCLIKDESGVVHPFVRINFTSPAGAKEFLSNRYNYFYWEDVGRYYYISEITLITATVMEIDCEVDVLASFQEDIHNTYAFVQYSEKLYNSMLPDNRLALSDRSNQQSIAIDMGLDANQIGCYVVIIASEDAPGMTGTVGAYVMNANEIHELANKLYQASNMDKLIDFLYSPQEAVIKCLWLPAAKDKISNGAPTAITYGTYELGHGDEAKRTVTGSTIIEPYVPYMSQHVNPDGSITEDYADFRNCEPYTEYTIWLPGAGLTEIPMVSLIGNGTEKPSFKIEYSLATTTGDVTYTIKRVNDSISAQAAHGDEILVVKGSLGVDIPISRSSSGFASAIGSAVAGTVQIVGGIALSETPFGWMMAANGVSQVAGATVKQGQIAKSAVGAIGGWAIDTNLTRYYYMFTKVNELSDYPSNVAKVIGRPLFKTCRLGDLEGLVRCTGAFVAPMGATDEEQRMIAQYVNSSANFIFGGLIICPGNYS